MRQEEQSNLDTRSKKDDWNSDVCRGKQKRWTLAKLQQMHSHQYSHAHHGHGYGVSIVSLRVLLLVSSVL